MMKLASILGLGLLLATGLSAVSRADGLPQGTYLDTCNSARIEGTGLVADCPGTDGLQHHSALINFDRCVGDIANAGGVLTCNMGVVDRVVPPVEAAPPVTTVATRCDDLHREAADLRTRRDAEFDPMRRAQIVGRLHGVEDQLDLCTP